MGNYGKLDRDRSSVTYEASFHLERLNLHDPQSFVQKFFLFVLWRHVGRGRLQVKQKHSSQCMMPQMKQGKRNRKLGEGSLGNFGVGA